MNQLEVESTPFSRFHAQKNVFIFVPDCMKTTQDIFCHIFSVQYPTQITREGREIQKRVKRN